MTTTTTITTADETRALITATTPGPWAAEYDSGEVLKDVYRTSQSPPRVTRWTLSLAARASSSEAAAYLGLMALAAGVLTTATLAVGYVRWGAVPWVGRLALVTVLLWTVMCACVVTVERTEDDR